MSRMQKIGLFLIKHKVLFLMLLVGLCFSIKRTTPYVVADAYHFMSDDQIVIGLTETYETDINFTSKDWYGFNLMIKEPFNYFEAHITVTEKDTGYKIYESRVTDLSGYYEDDSLEEYLFGEVIEVDPDKEYTLAISNFTDKEMICLCNDLGELWTRSMYLALSAGKRILLSMFAVSAFITLLYVLMFAIPKTKEILKKPENVFLFGSVLVGIAYLIIVPVFKVPDTINHYVRAYEMTKGYLLVPQGGMVNIPWNLVPYETHTYNSYVLKKFFHMTLDTNNLVEYDVVNMALYSPISYFLQAVGIGLADIVSNNTYVLMYAGSIFNLVGCTAILYYAIKYLPYGKWIVTFLSLTPMSLQQRSSLSVDAITYAIAVAMLAFCLYFRYEQKRMTKKSLALMYVLVLMISSVKIVYFVIGGLILLIPRDVFPNNRGWLHKLIAMVELFVFSFGWLGIAGQYLSTTRGGSASSEKMNLILHSPFKYIYIMNKTFWDDGADFLLQMLGSIMGSIDIEIAALLTTIVFIYLIKCYFEDKNGIKENDYLLTIFTLLQSAAMVVLVFTSLYIQWTSVDAAAYSIEGIQGRYMVPIAPVLLLGLLARKKTNGNLAKVSDNAKQLENQTGELGDMRFLTSNMESIYILLSIGIIVLLVIWGHISCLG